MKVVIEDKHPQRENDLIGLGALLAMVHDYNKTHPEGVMQKVWQKFLDELTEYILSGAQAYSDIEFEYDFGQAIKDEQK